LSRRLSRDRLQAGDIQPYDSDPQIADGERSAIPDPPADQSVELASLDLVKLGPYLLLLDAQESAANLLRDAQAAADKIREQSRSEGALEGREEAKQETLAAAVAFANAGQALIVFEEQMVARYTPEMVRLALEIAEKIVDKTLTAEPEIVAAVFERARQEVTDARRIRVHLNAADHQLLAQMRPDLLTMKHDGGRAIEVVADRDLSRGGCRLETEIGVVDATVPTQLAELRRQLLDGESETHIADLLPSTAPGAGVSREL
jgi:flagellar assembly protein FliH